MGWRYELEQDSNGKYGLYDNKQLRKDGKWGAYRISRKQIVVPFNYNDIDDVTLKCEEIERSQK